MTTLGYATAAICVAPCARLQRAARARGSRTKVSMRTAARRQAQSTRLSLLLALSSQAAAQSQRSIADLATEVAKYVNPAKRDARSLEEALMSVPDLETVPYTLVRREQDYEIREVESYVVAETIMPGRSGFDFAGSGQAFNTLAAYLFGKNTKQTEMAMTTPVVTKREDPEGEKMEMTTPVLQQASEQGQWRMSFVLPSKYSDNTPLPKDASVEIKRVPAKTVAGFLTDKEVKKREQALRRSLLKDREVRVKMSAQAEVAQFNPPFTPPFMRRNEVALEVESIKASIS